MKNKKKFYLMVILLACLAPSVVFADDFVPLGVAYLWSAFCSIHWHTMVMKPLAQSRSESANPPSAWKLSAIRAVILLIGMPFFPSLFLIDFIMLFIMVFIVIGKGIFGKITTTITSSTTLTNPKSMVCKNCGMTLLPTDKFCSSCGLSTQDGASNTLSQGANVSTFSFNEKYNANPNIVASDMINEELKKLGADLNKLTPQAKKRKIITTIIFAIITFIMISLIFFHLPFGYYLIEIVAIVLYLFDMKKGNLYKELIKEVKARPDEKISNIVASKVAQTENPLPNLTYLGIIAVAVFIPLIIFSTPKVFYEEYNDGYRVRFYAFGLTNMNTVEIPERYNGKAVVALRGNAFSNMPLLTKVKLPETITEINGQAFKNDINLKTIKLPSNLKYLGGSSFENCTSLESITIPDGITELEGKMFSDCTNLKEVKLPDYMNSIHGETFMNCISLETIKLPKGITEIRGDTFYNCTSLDNIVIPEGVKRIGGHAFENCNSLSNVTIPSSVNEIGSSAFRSCYNLESVKISPSVYMQANSFKDSPTTFTYYEN